MVDEAVQQYKDYYETDDEQAEFMQYLDDLSERDRIRFIDIFEDYTIKRTDNKSFATIPKREFNPELSVFGNMVLDLVDFNDRVKPMADDLSRLDASATHQRVSPAEARQQYDLVEHELAASDRDELTSEEDTETRAKLDSGDEGEPMTAEEPPTDEPANDSSSSSDSSSDDDKKQ